MLCYSSSFFRRPILPLAALLAWLGTACSQKGLEAAVKGQPCEVALRSNLDHHCKGRWSSGACQQLLDTLSLFEISPDWALCETSYPVKKEASVKGLHANTKKLAGTSAEELHLFTIDGLASGIIWNGKPRSGKRPAAEALLSRFVPASPFEVYSPSSQKQGINPKRQTLAKGCGSGDGVSCEALGEEWYEVDDLEQFSVRKAKYFYERACEKGRFTSCVWAADLWREEGVDGQADAVRLLKTACEQRDVDGCHQLGTLFADIDQSASALLWYRRACALDFGAGCYAAGAILKESTSSEATAVFKKARRLLEAECKKDGSGCLVWGFTLEYGEGGSADKKGALHAYDLACEYLAEDCFFAAEGWDLGLGIKRDAAKALFRYKKSCDSDEPNGGACHSAWTMLTQGDGVPADKELAEKYYEKTMETYRAACTAGDSESCEAMLSMSD